jgi:hypothetical protein
VSFTAKERAFIIIIIIIIDMNIAAVSFDARRAEVIHGGS